MKIYILWMKESYGDPAYIEGLFTSEEKAIEYRDAMIEKHRGVYEVNDFDIDYWRELDPEIMA